MKKQKTRICPVPDGYMTVNDIAEAIGVNPMTVRRWYQKGVIHKDESKSHARWYLFEKNELKKDLQKYGVNV